MRCFFVRPDRVFDDELILDREDVHHIRHVLRMSKGDLLQVSDGSDALYRVKILNDVREGMRCSILEKTTLPPLPGPRMTLLVSLPKGKRMEWLIQKSTEVGVHEVIPIVMQRSVRILDMERSGHWMLRWRRIAKEAAKQCGRFQIPIIKEPHTLRDALHEVSGFPVCIYFDPQEKKRSLSRICRDYPEAGRIVLLIGPEGGVTHEDAALLEEYDFLKASLGDLVLRVETAGIVSVALARYEWGRNQASREMPRY